MRVYAYIRVSSREQNVDRQLAALEPYGLPPKNIFCDHQSGRDFCRPAYRKLIRRLRPGDLVIVKSIDRLGRNYNEILTQWQKITREIQADILVLDMPLLDTRKKDGNLTGTLISDLVLQLLAYVAQTEREMIRQRQAEGIAAARARGVTFGRPQMAMPEAFGEVYKRWVQGEVSVRQGAALLGLKPSTFYRRCREAAANPEGEPSVCAPEGEKPI